MSGSAASLRRVRRRTDWSKVLLGLWTGALIFFLLVPIGFVIVHSMNGGKSFNIWKEWGGLQWYRELLDNKPLRATLVNSFKAAIGSTIIAVVIGALAGVALVRRGGRWTGFYLATLFLVMVTPRAAAPVRVMLLDGESAGPYHQWQLTTPALKSSQAA